MPYQGPSEGRIRWPGEKRVWTISAVFFGLALTWLAAYREYQQFTPFERWWFPAYIKTHLLLGVGRQFGDYRLLEAVGRNGKVTLVLDSEDARPGETQVESGKIPFVLSEEGARKGQARLKLSPGGSYYNDKLKGYLMRRTYNDQTLGNLLMRPLLRGLGALLVGRSEILNLRWLDVDLVHRLINLPQSKNGKGRTVYLNEAALNVFRSLPLDLHAEPAESVFGLEATPGEVSITFTRACRKVGIMDFRFHDLRHTHATWLRQSRVQLDEIAKQLGHSDLRMTQRYAHLGQSQVREAVDRLDSIPTPLKGPEPETRIREAKLSRFN